MSALAAPPLESPSLFESLDGGPTLSDAIAGAWEGLAAHADVACPVCGAAMSPRYAAGSVAVGGRCDGCGSSLT
jgi:hypothetical protein